MDHSFDVIICGAGAAGLMCAIEAGKRGRRVLVLDHARHLAEKIRISGGGRCNFTNLHCSPKNYHSANPHFVKSALKRFSQHDFIALVAKHHIPYHEKTLGQLFCDESSQRIIDMLLAECAAAKVVIYGETTIHAVEKDAASFTLHTSRGLYHAASVVVATGGLSIPKIGASDFGYRLATQFGHSIVPLTPALVPLTFAPDILALTQPLSGVAVDPVQVTAQNKTQFEEALLFTHRGLSGPAILQISSYWQSGEAIVVNLCPQIDALAWLKEARQRTPKQVLHNVLAALLPSRLAELVAQHSGFDTRLADLSDAKLQHVAQILNAWRITPAGSEGYRTAEVTRGGVNTDEVSSKTFESQKCQGLYFIGEVLDVTGHLGGFNFQWAWSSGWCAGQFV